MVNGATGDLSDAQIARRTAASVKPAMGVYVDDAIWEWRGERWCHLMADTDAELAAFAQRLGLKPVWLQHRPARPWLDHYDLPDYGRDKAIELGAVPVGRREIVELIRGKRDSARRNSSAPQT